MSSTPNLDRLVRVYRALGDGTRLRLVKLLADLEPGDARCVNALAAELGVSQPAVSQHLSVLRAVYVAALHDTHASRAEGPFSGV